MAIALGTPGTYIGPGFRFFITGVAGPVPNDDMLIAYLTRHSDGLAYSYGLLRPPVAGTNEMIIGWDERARRVTLGGGEGVIEGTAMDIMVVQYHANLSVVDTIAATAFGALDTHSYPWALMAKLAVAGGGGISDILDAVRIVKTTPGQV